MNQDIALLWNEAPREIVKPKIHYGIHEGENRLFITLEDYRSVYLFTPADPIVGTKNREAMDAYKEHRVFSCVRSKCKLIEYFDHEVYLLEQLKVISCTKPFNLAHDFVIKTVLKKMI
jgi:hypothetical protein